ncbi:complex I 51 kDa subunit family protein [Acidithiobacillus acidisediminis]|uniref:complex I 51 kDa subunit family protein n=1 Tax=Acidithiobacillus acidisediminis TaxID=2937799 RepID=UPI00200E1A18|nr:NADH-ubiquinone oxidoreductase-F iron-sulfur binding region domain-containing protein [Acidithiobacillus sp. S30A2]
MSAQPLSCLFDHDNPADLAAYRAVGGYEGLRKALAMTPEDLIALVEKSGLRGCGGAGFPTGVKWRLRGLDAPEPRYLVCNLDETEPGSFKDRALLFGAPQQILEGMLIAAHALGVQEAFLFIRGEYAAGAEVFARALRAADAAGLLDLPAGRLQLDIHLSLGRYICGEDSAILNAIEGRRPNPRKKPPHISQKGLWQQPTTVNNAESFAQIPGILREGLDTYRAWGVNGGVGSKLYSVCGPVQRPGVFELPMGTPMHELLYEHAGGPLAGREIRAVLPGGASTPFVLPKDFATPMHFDAMAKIGSRLGTGGCIVLDNQHCPLDFLIATTRFYARESCGFCTPCREGLPYLLWLLERIERGEGKMQDLDKIDSLGKEIAPNSFCALAPGALMPLLSGMVIFHDEIAAHVTQGHCPYTVQHG